MRSCRILCLTPGLVVVLGQNMHSLRVNVSDPMPSCGILCPLRGLVIYTILWDPVGSCGILCLSRGLVSLCGPLETCAPHPTCAPMGSCALQGLLVGVSVLSDRMRFCASHRMQSYGILCPFGGLASYAILWDPVPFKASW